MSMNDLLLNGWPIRAPASAMPRHEETSRSVIDQASTDSSDVELLLLDDHVLLDEAGLLL